MSTQQTVTDLNAGWRNVVVKALGLDPNTFQLAQGTLGLQTTDSSGLFRMADAVPPSSAVNFYDPTSMKSRASAYLNLLSALLPETSPQALQQALGDMYSNWIAYKTTPANWTPGATLSSVYTAWSNMAPIDPGRAARGAAAIQAAQMAPLNQAYAAYALPANQQTFTGTDGTSFTLYRYTATNQAATSAINGASGGASIDFDSSSMDTKTSSTFVQGAASGFYDIFSGGASGSFAQLNSKAVGSGFSIKGTLGKYTTLASGPGAWYTSAEVSRAFDGNGNANIWDPQASSGNWSSFFGQPNGALARYVSQLVLVSDYSLTVTSKATYSQSDYQQIQTAANFGIWPFFSASASASHTTSSTLNSDSTLSVTYTLPQGAIAIWGVTVQPQAG
jgi:hypothetical protein